MPNLMQFKPPRKMRYTDRNVYEYSYISCVLNIWQISCMWPVKPVLRRSDIITCSSVSIDKVKRAIKPDVKPRKDYNDDKTSICICTLYPLAKPSDDKNILRENHAWPDIHELTDVWILLYKWYNTG